MQGVLAGFATIGIIIGLGFLLERSRDPLSSGALVPCAVAVAGALLWTAPPRRPRARPGAAVPPSPGGQAPLTGRD